MQFLRRVKHLFVPHHDNAYHPHLLRRPYLVGLLALCLVAEGALVANLLLREVDSGLFAAVIRSDVVALTNTERAAAGVATLEENDLLTAAAQAKAADMAGRQYFSHDGPDGKKPWDWIIEAGYDYQYAGENLAVRFIDSKDVVEAWMASPTHKRNIVKNTYTEIGIGIAHGVYKGEPATYVVQYFGKPTAGALKMVEARGEVLGASAAVTSFMDSAVRQILRLFADPQTNSLWVLGSVATLLLLVLAFALFHHVQIQSHQVLAPGAVVAVIALTLLAFNTQLLAPAGSQTAAVAYGMAGVEVGSGEEVSR